MSSRQKHEEALFALALEIPTDKRPAFLDATCEGDPILRQRLEARLAAHDQPDALSPKAAPAVPATMKLGFPDAPDEAVGQTLGRYKLLEQLGEGGCGVVYVAEQTQPVRRRVALKVIKLGMDTKQVVARFEAERQALAMMDHPNIAKVLDAGATETGRPFFVMELVRGIRITDYCDQNNLTTSERLKLFMKVCQAIQHAHQKGIIHRDIKPSNILVTLHDGVPVPKVIDFGIAKATEGRLTDATVYTQLQQFIGTPAYTSPEQAEMSGLDIDTRSDIYSLGVLLYELLAGSTPFDANELISQGIDGMRKTIREKEPMRPSTRFATLQGAELTTAAKRRSTETSKLMHQLKGDLDWIVMKCLEKDRTRRYETANGLNADLKRYLDNEPVLARPPGAGYKIQKFVRRHRAGVLAGGLVLVALVAGIMGTTWGLVDALKQKREAERERSEADRQGRIARHTTDFLTGMFQSIDPGEAQLRDITVREVLDQASGKIGTAFPGDPLTELPIRRTFVDVYSKLGKPYSALTNAQAALALAQLAYGDKDSEPKAESLSDLANCLDSASRSSEALPIHRQALAMVQRIHQGDEPGVAKRLAELAVCQVDLGLPDEALTNFEAALAIFQRIHQGDNLDLADTLYGIANCKYHLGRSAEAVTNFEATLAMFKRIYPGDYPDTSTCMDTLAQCQETLGRYAEALTNFHLSLAMSQRYFRGDHPNVADALGNLAHCQVNMERFADALTNNHAAWTMFKRIYQGDNSRVATAQANMALCQARLGRYAESLTNREECLAMFRRLHHSDDLSVAISTDLLADCLDNLGRHAEAATNFEAALSMGQRLRSFDDLIMSRDRNRFGDCLNFLGRLDEARQQYEKALAIYRQRATAPPTEKSGKVGLARTRQKLGDLLVESGRTADAATNYQAGLQLAEAVLGADATDADAKALRLTCRVKLGLEKAAVVVHQILPQSQALDIGLLPGDVLVSYDGKPVVCSADLPLLTARATGTGIVLDILRAGAPLKLAVNAGPLGSVCEDRSIVKEN
jgi:eukaryotic-like serine/threonine-protein kinase